MENNTNFIFKPNYILYIILSLLFLSTKAEGDTLSIEEFINELTLKMKGPIEQYGFFYNESEGYCFKGENPSKIIVNGKEYKYNISNLTEFELGNNTINLIFEKTVSNFSGMFNDCDDIIEVDLSKMKFNISTNLEYMFSNCKSLTSIKFFSIEERDITVKLNYMFSNCNSLTFLDLSNISVYNNKYYNISLYMNYMFKGCTSLNSINIFNITAESLYMEHMFSDCNSLSSIKIYNIYSSYEYEGFLNMSFMFSGCSSLDSVDIINFDVDGNLIMNNMFNDCISLNSLSIINIYAENIDIKNIFYHCTFKYSVNISEFHLVVDFNAYKMFNDCTFHNLVKIQNFEIDVDSSFYTNYMFNNCKFFGSVNLLNIYGYYGYDLYLNNTFNNCSFLGQENIFNIKLDCFYYIYMNYMFQKCIFNNSNNIIDINADGSKINLYMNYMFSDCVSLNSNYSYILHFNGNNSLIEMNNLYNNCKYLTFVNFSNVFINSNYGKIFMNYIFKNCFSLISVDFSNFVLTGINSSATMNYMFSGCKNLKYINFNNSYFNTNLQFISPFDDIPENIAYCIDENHPLNSLLSQKGCSILDCSDNWQEKQNKIIYKSNTCIDKCSDKSLFDYQNFCYEFCPENTYEDEFICEDCYSSCKSCGQPGTEENHNCNECKNEYNLFYYKANHTINCYKNYSYNYEGIDIFMNECPIGNSLVNIYLYDFYKCYYQYKNDPGEYINCYPIYDYDYSCYINCPSEFPYAIMNIQNCKYYCHFGNYNKNWVCFFDNENKYNKEKKLYIFLGRLNYMIYKNLYINFDKFILFEEQGYNFIITTNQNEQYRNDFNNTKFNQCENNFKEKYQITNNDILFLLIVTPSEDFPGFLKQYEIYYFSDYFYDFLWMPEICTINLEEEEEKEEGESNCPKDFYFKIITTNKCVKSCNIQERQNKICLSLYNDENINDNNTIDVKNETNINEIQDNILKDIKDEILGGNFNVSNIDKNDIVIEEKGTKFILTNTENQKNNKENKNMTIIDLGECETELRKEYKLSGNIYILKVDKEQEGLKIPKIEYEVYTINNNSNLIQLNLSVCEKLKIGIYIPFNMSKDDYDKYDLNSGYYEDICYTHSENGVDVTLKDRKDEFIENNMTLCEENCDYERYDDKIGKAICSCLTKIKMPLISEISFDKNKIIEKFTDFKNIANIYIFKCYYLLLNQKGLIKNIGFLIMCPVFGFYVISIFVFCCKDIKNINKINNDIINIKRNIEQNKNRGKTKRKENTQIKDNDKNQEINIIRLNKSSKKRPSKPSKLKLSKNKKNPPIKKSNTKKIKRSIILNNNHNIFFKKKNQRKDKDISNIMSGNNSRKKIKPINPIINLENKYNKIMEYNPTELNILPYKQAKEFDQRTYCQYYLNLVNSKNILLFAFYKSNDYNSRIMKINLFFYMFIVHFGVNALFFNDSTMHQIREDKGSFNFLYQIPQIVFSFIISAILNKILQILSLSEKDILELKRANVIDLNKKSKSIKNIIMVKFVFFFIFSFIVLVFFLFYLSCFCVVYKNTQIHLIKDTLISFGTSFITPFFTNLIPGWFRIPALKSKNNKECLYNFSKAIQMI